MLVDAGADVNAQGGYYGNALQAASDGSHEKIVQTLLDSGTDQDVKDQYGRTALFGAAANGHIAVVKL
jgi:ankyrin repeat protein